MSQDELTQTRSHHLKEAGSEESRKRGGGRKRKRRRRGRRGSKNRDPAAGLSAESAAKIAAGTIHGPNNRQQDPTELPRTSTRAAGAAVLTSTSSRARRKRSPRVIPRVKKEENASAIVGTRSDLNEPLQAERADTFPSAIATRKDWRAAVSSSEETSPAPSSWPPLDILSGDSQDDDLELEEAGACLTDDETILNLEVAEIFSARTTRGQLITLQSKSGSFRIGELVRFEFSGRHGLATAVAASRRVMTSTMFPVANKISADDHRKPTSPSAREEEIVKFCRLEARKLNLRIKVIRAWLSKGGTTIVLSYASEGKPELSKLLSRTSRHFGLRLEATRIRNREEASKIGGIGLCGRELCCSRWLSTPPQVNVRMAREQNLSLTPSRISGPCGLLKCCLRYEQSHYEKVRRSMPKIGIRVTTPAGPGRVSDIDIPREEIRVFLDNGSSKSFSLDMITPQSR